MLKSARTGDRSAQRRSVRSRVRTIVGAVALAALTPLTAQAATVSAGNRSFDVESTAVQNEGYQVAHSAKNDRLWVTGTSHHRTLGFPEALKSALTEVNPSNLQVLRTITPPTLPAQADPQKSERPEAVYGVAVDDEYDRVWTSITREDAVVVYDAVTGARIKRIDGVGHSRDIAIDPYRNTAYVSDPNNGSITKIDTETLVVKETLTNLGGSFSPMSLDLYATPTQALLYTVNLNDGLVLEIDSVNKTTSVVGQSGGNRASGIAVDVVRRRAYVASQDSRDLRTMNLDTGQVVGTAQASGAVLNVAVDSDEGIVYSAVFGSSTVLVSDADTGARIGEIPLGTSPNDVIVANGKAWAVDRSTAGQGGVSQLWRITPAGSGGGGGTDPGPTTPTIEIVGQATLGGTVTLRGTNWKHPSNGGSTIAIKLDDGKYQKTANPAEGVWQVIEANADGSFEATLRLPDGTTGPNGSNPAYPTGAHWLRFLTGSLKPGDQGRSIKVDLNVGAATGAGPTDPGTTTPGTTTPGTTDPGTTPKAAAKAKPKVGASVKRTFSQRERVTIKAVVNGRKPTGTIVVRVGKRTVKVARLTKPKGNQAIVTVKLPRLKPGNHTVTVFYLGDNANARNYSKAVLRVTR